MSAAVQPSLASEPAPPSGARPGSPAAGAPTGTEAGAGETPAVADVADAADAADVAELLRAHERAVQHLISLQKPDGGWEGEMVWNTMILSQYVIVQHAVGRRISAADKAAMIKHYRVNRTPGSEGGGWGMHGESPAYVFFTALAYVALRLLGVDKDDPLCADARAFLHRQPGGVLAIPHWGKFWLAMCGLYGYEGVNPFPPEVFLLPSAVPISPFNYYNHTRYIYLGIATLYGRRFRIDLGPLRDALRAELYTEPYDGIDFHRYRHEIAPSDVYVRPSAALRAAYDVLHRYERRPIRLLRERALKFCMERILYEMRNSAYQGVSPVNGLLNCLALFAADPCHPELGKCLDGMEAWKWQDEAEGIRYCGARSNSWDTAFAVQALCAAPEEVLAQKDVRAALRRAYRHLCGLQMREELPDYPREKRAPIRGGWCFSDGVHKWAVSDCTAEAVIALVSLHYVGSAVPPEERISDERLTEAARFILLRQNDDGGFGSYEARRAGGLLEHINPSEMYGSCMTERSYLECTASCIRGLVHLCDALRGRADAGLIAQMEGAIERGSLRLRRGQLGDGSYPGFWGINFTYGIFHVVEALRETGVNAQDPAVARAEKWLLGKQKPDGGWGEHYKSCLDGRYAEHPETQVVMTSWALLALLLGQDASDPRLLRAARFLASVQLPDGGFPQQAQNGVFFGTAMLDYRLYKSYFPVWALGRYLRMKTDDAAAFLASSADSAGRSRRARHPAR
ncbi:MAG: prenyltransferase/squalene oxidase repeat-containing protein [Polyangia bacterium]